MAALIAKDAFFHGAGALEAPNAGGYGGAVFRVGLGFIGGEDINVAGEAVAKRVETATGFAFGVRGPVGPDIGVAVMELSFSTVTK